MPADNTQRLAEETKHLVNRRSGQRLRRDQSQQEKDAARLGLLEKLLIDHAHGRLELSATQVMAARAIYDKLRPSLSAIEQTTIHESDLTSEEQIVQALSTLIAQRPEIVDYLVDLREKQRQAEANAAAGASSSTAQ